MMMTKVHVGTALALGLVAGFMLRPVLLPVGAVGIDRPTDAEATAALRANPKLFNEFSKKHMYEQTTLKLGDCSPGTLLPGIVCFAELKDQTQPSRTRSIGFARMDGKWHMTDFYN
jgi:hypothetical protein